MLKLKTKNWAFRRWCCMDTWF